LLEASYSVSFRLGDCLEKPSLCYTRDPHPYGVIRLLLLKKLKGRLDYAFVLCT